MALFSHIGHIEASVCSIPTRCVGSVGNETLQSTFLRVGSLTSTASCLLTSGEAIPDLQPVVAAEDTSRGRRVRLQLEALELQNDLGHLGGEDHKRAVQVVGVFLREPRRLYDSAVGGEVPRAFGTCSKDQRRRRDGKWEDETKTGTKEGADAKLFEWLLVKWSVVGVFYWRVLKGSACQQVYWAEGSLWSIDEGPPW